MKQLPAFSLGEFGIDSMHVSLEWHYNGEAELRVIMFPTKDAHGVDQAPKVVQKQVFVREFVERTDAGKWKYIVRSQILKALAHEVDEWLLCDGLLVTEPHPEAKAGG